MDCDTRIPRSRRRVAVDDDQTGGNSSYSNSPFVTPGGIALGLRNPKPFPTVGRLSFTRWPIFLCHQLLRYLMLRQRFTFWLQQTQVKKPLRYSRSLQEPQGQQDSGSERCAQQSVEASSWVSSFLPGPDLQLGPPHPSLFPSVEARPSVVYP